MTLFTVLSFVKKDKEAGDVYTFSFKANHSLNHKAGQHGLFLLPGLYRPHPFTLSSSPEEDLISFTTHVGTGSSYKKKLMTMKTGSKMFLLGPILNFTFIDNETRYVFLAQGVGITPFRSMLQHKHDVKLPIETTLIHVDSKEHAFKDLTKEYATNAHYPTNPEEFQSLVKAQDSKQKFYLSGSPGFISSTKQILKDMSVSRSDIKTDSFLGY